MVVTTVMEEGMDVGGNGVVMVAVMLTAVKMVIVACSCYMKQC